MISPGQITILIIIAFVVTVVLGITGIEYLISNDKSVRYVVKECQDDVICYFYWSETGAAMSCIKDKELAEKYCSCNN